MEKFEEYRKNLAEEIKETPKEERKAKLGLERDNPEYKKAKELSMAKREVYKLVHTETLESPEDPDKVADWIKTELEDYAERQDAYLMGFMLEEFFEEVTKYLSKRLKIDNKGLENLDVAKHQSDTTYGEHDSNDEGTTRGSLSLMGREIINYSSYSDGYGFSIDEWHEDNLREATVDLLKLLKSRD